MNFQRSELIWEAAYNGGSTLGSADSVNTDDLFWKYIAGSGANPGSTFGYTMHTLAEWGDLYSSNAFVSAFGVGNGGGAGASFSALADNLALTTTAGRTSVNFASSTVAVPEPATWALMLIGFGGIGAAMLRSRRRSPNLIAELA